MIAPKIRFDRHWQLDERSGCWLWTGGGLTAGYGTFRMGGTNALRTTAQRASWLLHRGEIPSGMFVLHSCDTPPCVRPEHLFLGTHLDNMRDMVAKGRHCRGTASHLSKLTEAQVIAIRASVEPSRVVAPLYGVDPSTIRYVRRGDTWSTTHL